LRAYTWRDLCFDAQQGAEKAVKAIFVARDLDFPYVHDLAALLTLLERGGVTVPDAVRSAGRLTRFAIEARYPGVGEPVEHEEYERAVATASAVVAWATEQIDL